MHYVNTRGIAIANATACNCIGAVLQLQRSSNGEAMMLLHCLAMEWQWSGNDATPIPRQYAMSIRANTARIDTVFSANTARIDTAPIPRQYRAV